ncbi:MAG: cell surface protein [Lascolabacillus sp.]|nr:cell surface protein [Lascolabacillus sp.]
MKKSYFFKFFVFALVGALAILPSCKDYDDDISGLETSVSTVKSDLTALQSSVSSAQSAATAAQSTATDALAKANEALAAAQAAGDAEAIAALETQVAGLVAQIADINEELEALAGLEARVEALMAELEAANEAQLEAIIADIAGMSEELQGMVGDMVTAVKLIGAAPALKFSTIKEKENVFAEGIANAITFVKDKPIQSLQTLVIQVSPANAEITPEMVTLQNSKGIAYDNIEIVSVKPYNQLLTRSTDGSGLWEVTVRLKEYVEKDFNAATKTDAGKVLFAVAINNTTTEANPLIRKVTTDYAVTLENETAPAMNSTLNYFVNDKHVFTLKNRYGVTGGVTEYVWSSTTPAVAAITTGANKNVTEGDNRSMAAKNLYPAVQGQKINIALTKLYNDSKVDKPDYVRAIYVTLDKGNTDESDPSELNAWNSYTYTGLNTVVEGTETTITVDGPTAIDDVIGFRVYAVNVDGTLVDPDGKAFYVKVGKDATDWNALNTVVTASDAAATATNSASVNATLSKLDGATKFEWTTDKADDAAETTPAFDVVFTDADNATVFGTDGTGAITADFSKVTKVHTVATVNDWLAYKDNKVYKGKLVIKNASDHVLATLEVTFKKELPTAAPKGLTPKAGQIINGVHTSFMVPAYSTGTPATTTDGTHGNTKPLNEIFAFGATTMSKYTFSFANSDKDSEGKLIAKDVTGGANVLTVAKEFIDNSTAHAATVTYNFGKISTETKDNNGIVIDYIVPVYNFNIVYSNVYKTYTWNWATRTQLVPEVDADDPLPYETSVKQDATGYKVKAEHIYGVSTTKSYSTLLSSAEKLEIQGAKLISNESKNEDYFTVAYNATGKEFTFTAVTADKLTVNVPSTLVISAKDFYGNDVVIEIPVTVIP